ncbi:hypothetical protein HOLleu_24642 [Holothuria leucospilota]|uniref:Uncharacterized protein n=1 Tax=Holothuria leucospilota TaxID=206669 RepID=A0A9Q1BRQ2_HOLLE|nr:hypothetical protein HOLleu_24642 [Holothuria leucospilota]
MILLIIAITFSVASRRQRKSKSQNCTYPINAEHCKTSESVIKEDLQTCYWTTKEKSSTCDLNEGMGTNIQEGEYCEIPETRHEKQTCLDEATLDTERSEVYCVHSVEGNARLSVATANRHSSCVDTVSSCDNMASEQPCNFKDAWGEGDDDIPTTNNDDKLKGIKYEERIYECIPETSGINKSVGFKTEKITLLENQDGSNRSARATWYCRQIDGSEKTRDKNLKTASLPPSIRTVLGMNDTLGITRPVSKHDYKCMQELDNNSEVDVNCKEVIPAPDHYIDMTRSIAKESSDFQVESYTYMGRAKYTRVKTPRQRRGFYESSMGKAFGTVTKCNDELCKCDEENPRLEDSSENIKEIVGTFNTGVDDVSFNRLEDSNESIKENDGNFSTGFDDVSFMTLPRTSLMGIGNSTLMTKTLVGHESIPNSRVKERCEEYASGSSGPCIHENCLQSMGNSSGEPTGEEGIVGDDYGYYSAPT